MSKLFKLKRWLSLSESAKHLSTVLGDEVSVADLLRLALDGRLVLSVVFVNSAYGQICKLFDRESAEWLEVPPLRSGRPPLRIPKGGAVVFIAPDGREYQCCGAPIPLENDEPYDLTMIGAERLSVQHAYQLEIGGPPAEWVAIDGAILAQSGNYFQLSGHFSENPYFDQSKLNKSWAHASNFYPAGLPDDATIVVRPASLTNLTRSLEDADALLPQQLSVREQTSYLNIIAGLLDLMLGKTPSGKAQSVFTSQSAIISALTAHHHGKQGITQRTLEQKFAEARRSLGAG